MPRVRWCCSSLPIMCLLGVCTTFWMAPINADCWYEGENHEEGIEVTTAEPCLNCTCNRGALLCYLRICPKLPNPPPKGCILLHRYRTCCPELICSEISGGGNGLEARYEPDEPEIIHREAKLRNACVSNGSVYGPGSAMDSSSFCEFCYCLGGKQTCVKPKCLLPIEGCKPIYDSTNCCPVQYNCSSSVIPSSTTTIKPKETINKKSSCLVDGVHYEEGGKVLGVGYSVCDNCYCLRGVLRCEPLSCAPPLLGCLPVIKLGECCAASYNCSGTIEIQPEPNYGQFPIVSKEYAKFRKEAQLKPTQKSTMPFYVVAESPKPTTKLQRSPSDFGTTRHFIGATSIPTTTKPTDKEEINQESSTLAQNKPYYATTSYEFQNITHKRVYSTTNQGNESNFESTENPGDNDNFGATLQILVDGRFNRKVPNETNLDLDLDLDLTTDSANDETTTEQTTIFESTTDSDLISTKTTILNSTDCKDNIDDPMLREDSYTTILPVDINEINQLAIIKNLETTSGESFSSEISNTEDDVTEIDLESRVKVGSATLRSIPKISIEIEAILNLTKSKNNDYEYDYNEPSLPPSLPNLRIIPFVAADALDSKKDVKDNTVFQKERVTDTSFGLFSPPIETEGGFVPKEPPILDNFYENAVNTVPSITNPPKSSEINCLSGNREIIHGQSVESESPCVTCTCFYGSIVCQNAPCPLPRPNCRKSAVQDNNLCCPHYICGTIDDDEAPTVVLDRLEANIQSEAVTVAKKVATPDPFRDVIRTEPAPNLQSLIGDMMPFLARKTTTTTTEVATKSSNDNDDFSFDKVFQLLFSETTTPKIENQTVARNKSTSAVTTSTTTSSSFDQIPENMETRENLNSSENHPNSIDSSVGVGILKLAGCNIYGRMYRVGRIISELSNPCLECKCTEIGVQCRALKC